MNAIEQIIHTLLWWIIYNLDMELRRRLNSSQLTANPPTYFQTLHSIVIIIIIIIKLCTVFTQSVSGMHIIHCRNITVTNCITHEIMNENDDCCCCYFRRCDAWIRNIRSNNWHKIQWYMHYTSPIIFSNGLQIAYTHIQTLKSTLY